MGSKLATLSRPDNIIEVLLSNYVCFFFPWSPLLRLSDTFHDWLVLRTFLPAVAGNMGAVELEMAA
ncbi:hypothetical protein MRB53_032462 [Persea americana]|uniref:Uncharacterized protein n=1 Tax=Persea americana TaxID=3435 RepID=A0ACC2KS96_PERAE|nr:hypothetical protein MRB53_032462 [Persea americana]